MGKRKVEALLLAGLLLLAFTLAQRVERQLRLLVNGKPASSPALVVGGKTYIPLEALKAAGVKASLQGSTLSLSLPLVQGGAEQVAALEGCLNEWLFNGIWRFRVLAVEPLAGEPGFRARVELRNGTPANGAALSGTGFEGLFLALEDGRTIRAVSDAVELRDNPFPPGAGMVYEALFYPEAQDVGKAPSKLLLILDPKRMLTSLDIRYTVPDPSFRVRLDCRK